MLEKFRCRNEDTNMFTSAVTISGCFVNRVTRHIFLTLAKTFFFEVDIRCTNFCISPKPFGLALINESINHVATSLTI